MADHAANGAANDIVVRFTRIGMYKYGMILYWSAAGSVFFTKCLSFPDAWLMVTRKKPHWETSMRKAFWIETAREFCDPIPGPKGERLMLA